MEDDSPIKRILPNGPKWIRRKDKTRKEDDTSSSISRSGDENIYGEIGNVPRRILSLAEDNNYEECSGGRLLSLETGDIPGAKKFETHFGDSDIYIALGEDSEEEPTHLYDDLQLDPLELLEKYACEGDYTKFETHLNEIDFENWPTACEVLNRIHVTLVKYLDYPETANRSIKRCYDILRDNKRYRYVDVNYEDEDHHCALYYAANSEAHDVITTLLKRKASLGNVDVESKKINLEFIPVKILEGHFDSCIELEINDYFRLFRFDYETLYPSFEQNSSNFEAISRMTQNPEFRKLLNHPTISSFIYVTWEEFKWLNYVRTFWYTIFTFLPVIFIFVPWYIFIALFFYAIAYVLGDFMLNSRRMVFFKDFKNIVNLSSILIYLVKMFIASKYQNQVNAVMFIPMMFQILILLEYVDYCSIYVIMFRIVSVNFVKLIVNYVAIILTLALCYYCIIFSGHELKTSDTIFGNFSESIFNTLLLLPAEYRLESLQFNFLTATIFIILVLFTLILMNLINALAFSDTLKAREEAELLKLQSRVTFIESFMKYQRSNFNYFARSLAKVRFLNRISSARSFNWAKNAKIWMRKNVINCYKTTTSSRTMKISMHATWMWTNTLNRARNIVILREQLIEDRNKLQKLQLQLEQKNDELRTNIQLLKEQVDRENRKINDAIQALSTKTERSKQYVENSLKRINKQVEKDGKDIKKNLRLSHMWTITAIMLNMGSKAKYEEVAEEIEKQYEGVMEFPYATQKKSFGELLRVQMRDVLEKLKVEVKPEVKKVD